MSETFFNTEINWHPFIEAHVRRFRVELCERWAQFVVGGFITVTIEDRGEEPKKKGVVDPSYEPTRWRITLRGLGRRESADLPGHLVFDEVRRAAAKAVQRWREELRDLAAVVSTMPYTVAV